MEYSKEDLMEAKKQIWGVGENMGTEESKKIWEENAQFWDNAMGDESNEFHREVVRPKVTERPLQISFISSATALRRRSSSFISILSFADSLSVMSFDRRCSFSRLTEAPISS